MARCTHCEAAINDPDTAVFDGEFWFCNHMCLGQWVSQQAESKV